MKSLIRLAALALPAMFATPAFAEMLAAAPASKIDAGDTAWMIAATALVLMMTIPGLALFYCGMVRKKNVLATMAQSVAAVCLISILWAVLGYTLAFSGDAPALGNLERMFLRGIGMDSVSPLAKTIPESLFMIYQMTFAIITVALVSGAVADRMRFSAFLLFSVLWLFVVYVPLAHWVWGGGFLQTWGVLDFAGGTVVHINAGVAGLVAALVLGKRRGYGTENLAPYDLSLAVIGTGLLWVGWFGFNGGSALGAGSRASMAIVATHLAACAGALTWMALEWLSRGKPSVLGLISGAIAGSRHHHARIRLRAAVARHRDRHRRGRRLLLGLHQAQAVARLRRLARRVRRARRRRRDRHDADRRVRGRGAFDGPGFARRLARPARRQSGAGRARS